jgi:SNF2 family DNA or RNA helicase
MLTKRVRVDAKKNKMIIDGSKIFYLNKKKFDAIILDESHKMKDWSSLNFDVVSTLALSIKQKILLTGTPFGKDLSEIWSQYYLIDKGATFGSNFYRFRDAYFVDKGTYYPKWEVTSFGRKYIEERLYTSAIRYEEDEVDQKLPEKTFRKLVYSLTNEQRHLYLKLLSNDISDDERVKNVNNRSMAYRQICSGFLKSSDFVFKKNPKLEVLKDLIETVVNESKIVIFHEFVKEGLMIEEMLQKMKIKYTTLDGRTKNKYDSYKSFEKDKSIRVMIAHPKSGGSSIEMIAANYCVFYSNSGSLIDRKQCIKRTHRPGQTKRCYFYDVIASGTVESSMYLNLNNDMDAFEEIMDANSYKKFMLGEKEL